MSSSGATAHKTLGVRTRAQKRRIGERDVWDLIVNNDDICFKHIHSETEWDRCEILVRR